jgi:MtN3 and saliva related transmembrane protein
MVDERPIEAMGTAAAICSMTSFAPQIIKIWRENDASGVSTLTNVVIVTGFVLWTTYGVLLGSWPVMVSNTVCLLMSATVPAMKLRLRAGS